LRTNRKNGQQGKELKGRAVTCAVAQPPASFLSGTREHLIVDAVRCWREARDHGRAVLPILFARLELRHAGFLAPAIDALLAVLEAWSGRRFTAGGAAGATLTGDERQLLALLDSAPPPAATHAARPGLTAPLHVALRSTRLIMRGEVGQQRDAPATPTQAPIFFVAATEGKAERSHAGSAQQTIVPASD
jgi:hypothetical protein